MGTVLTYALVQGYGQILGLGWVPLHKVQSALMVGTLGPFPLDCGGLESMNCVYDIAS